MSVNITLTLNKVSHTAKMYFSIHAVKNRLSQTDIFIVATCPLTTSFFHRAQCWPPSWSNTGQSRGHFLHNGSSQQQTLVDLFSPVKQERALTQTHQVTFSCTRHQIPQLCFTGIPPFLRCSSSASHSTALSDRHSASHTSTLLPQLRQCSQLCQTHTAFWHCISCIFMQLQLSRERNWSGEQQQQQQLDAEGGWFYRLTLHV